MTGETSRILVVDDDPVNREILTHHFRSKGYNIAAAADGREALDLLARETFDLLLLDIIMPKVNGYEVLKEIRKSHTLVELPVIMVTAKDTSGDLVEALRLGANDYLTKPVDVDVALARVRTHLLLKQLQTDLQAEKEFSESLIRSAYEMIISVDMDRNITQFNPAAEKLFGYGEQEVLGQPVDMLYSDPAEGQRVHELTIRENGFTGEVHNKRKNDEEFISYLSASVLRDKWGAPMGLMGISYDVTEQKKLKERHDALERMRQDFIAIASHDLKNPLTGIKGYAVLLLEEVDRAGSVAGAAVDYIRRVRALAELMQQIVEDFLDFQALEDGQVRLQFEPVQLNELARVAGDSNAEYARTKAVQIDFDLDASLPTVAGDKTRIAQTLHNLVNNAVKFNRPQGRVVIRTRAEPESLLVELSDTGPGIRPDEMPRLFVKYARLSTRPTGGEKSSGLGLAISRMLVELHGGEIGARNNPEGGATFWFRIPRVPKGMF